MGPTDWLWAWPGQATGGREVFGAPEGKVGRYLSVPPQTPSCQVTFHQSSLESSTSMIRSPGLGKRELGQHVGTKVPSMPLSAGGRGFSVLFEALETTDTAGSLG